MDGESEITKLRDKVSQMKKDQVRRARRMATMNGILSVAGLIAGVLAFVQWESASRHQSIALEMERKALLAEEAALRSSNLAELSRNRVIQLTTELENCKSIKK